MCLAGDYDPIALVIAASNHRIVSPSDVTDRLEYDSKHPPPNERAMNALEYFKSSLLTYLHGSGHVALEPGLDLVTLAGAELQRCYDNNATLRAELFLKATTDMTILPADADWRLKVRSLG